MYSNRTMYAMEVDDSKTFISPQMFQKFSYSHFSLFSNVEEFDAHTLSKDDDDYKSLNSHVIEVQPQCLAETKLPHENGKQKCAEIHDPVARVSSVSSDEQKSYFMLTKMLKRGTDALGEAEKKIYNLLHSKVTREQRMYLKLLKAFCMRNPLPYSLEAEVEKYVQEVMMYCWEEPLKYSRYYTINNLVPIISTAKTCAAFEHLQSIVHLGQVHYFNFPSVKSSQFLTRNYAKLNLKYPTKPSSDNWLKMPISKDPNVRMLAVKYGANVVMSFGSLQTIFANHEHCLENSWEMPVIVTEKVSGIQKTETSKKLVFIDKAFLKPNLTVFEKNLLYQKLALREALLQPKHKWSVDCSNLRQSATVAFDKKETPISPILTSEIQLPVTGVTREDECSDKSSDSEIYKLVIEDNPKNQEPDFSNLKQSATVTFDKKETPKPPIAPVLTSEIQLPVTTHEDECSDQSSDSEICKLFIDDSPISQDTDIITGDFNAGEELKEETSKEGLSKKQEIEPGGSRNGEGSKNPFGIIAELQTNTFRVTPSKDNASATTPEDPSNLEKPPAGWNVCYQLWKIGNMIALVRCSVDGVSKLKGQHRFWQLTPKLEYQPKHGAQALTFTEYVHQWISTVMVPNSSLARVRINAFNSEIIGAEDLDLHKVIPTKNLAQISECISNTATILSELTSLPCGNYLINHASNEGSVNILREVGENERDSSSNVYDLHLKYLTANATSFESTLENIPWISIDPSVLFFHHSKACSIPALFCPKASNMGSKKNKNKKFSKYQTVKS